jgi:O-Antigen ligase
LANPARTVAFYAALGVIFLRYSLLHEMLTYYSGANTRVLYLFSIPALLGVAASGGLRRCISWRPTWYWAGFLVWMCLAVPFSVWRGESARYAFTYMRAEIPVMILMAGLVMTWKEFRAMLFTVGLAGLFNVATGLLFGTTYGMERFGLQFGTIQNPNDFAAHLLLVLPVVAFMVRRPPQVPILGTLLRLAATVALVYGTYLVVASGSRGAFIAIVAAGGFVFLKVKMPARTAMVVGVPLAVIALLALLPAHTIERLGSYSTEVPAYGDEASESALLRSQLLRESIKATFSHPLFGVGPGTFADYTGNISATAKWINPHNSYTQISSETGFPGLIFYLAGILSPFLLLQKTWKRVRNEPELRDVATACFCLSVGIVGFCVAILFVNFGYFFYLPAFAGTAVAMHGAVDREIALRKPAPAEPVPDPRRQPAALATGSRIRFRRSEPR